MRLKEDIHAQNVKLRIENHDLKTRLENAKNKVLWYKLVIVACVVSIVLDALCHLHNFS